MAYYWHLMIYTRFYDEGGNLFEVLQVLVGRSAWILN